MKTNKLCPRCQVGARTYLLDKHSTECPYLICHDGKTCTAFKPIPRKKEKSKLHIFCSKFFKM